MIILSGLLVIGAIALLVAGIVVQDEAVLGLHGLQLIYISIAVSIVSFLCLAIGVFLRRRELFGTVPARPAKPVAKSRPTGRAARQAAARTAEEPEEPDDPMPQAFPMPSAQVPDDALVHVVPGRKRYHLDTCRQLAGRPTEELTYVEAQEEGFSPCTACLPDTALAARATAGPADGGTSLAEGPDASVETVHDSPYLGAPADPYLAGAARTEAFPATTSGAEPFSAERRAEGFGTPFETGRTETFPAEPPRASAAEPPRGGSFTTDPVEPWHAVADPAGSSAPSAAPVADTVTDWVPTTFGPGPLDGPVEPVADEPAEGRWKRVVEPVAAEPIARSGDTVVAEEPEVEPRATVPAPAPAPAEPVVEPAPPVPAVPQVSVPESREPESPVAAEPPAGSGPLVRILSGTKRYHRPECALIEDIGEDDEDLESLPRTEAKERGCTPCLVCQPDKEPAV
ncbi:hypothetical protein LO762_16805 [Actinocorallia sp. API 0066]|uniref:hypothetical protein n=1 Tax=Actinocorallia sp. API 0066 TaxID=2896846 RepID=UPI001E45A9DA|nr:hypothetical protein [Actinocorallia sp. API 0066]MCD0450840.1 hypothetical protein [Actinocorallia sp. API 0066]